MSTGAPESSGLHYPRMAAAGAAVLLTLALARATLVPTKTPAPGPALTGKVIAASWTAGKPGRYQAWFRITRRDGKPFRGNPMPDCVTLADAATGELVFHTPGGPGKEWWKLAPGGWSMDYYVEGVRSRNAPLPAALVPLVEETRTPALRKRLAQWRIWAPLQFGPNQESGDTYPLLPERVLRPGSPAKAHAGAPTP